MTNLALVVGQKFALLAVENIYADLPDGDHQLSDGTLVLKSIPIDLETNWARWIGSLRADQIRNANLVLLRALDSKNPTIAGDDEQALLTSHVVKLFSMLQLEGVPEYAESDVLAGSVLDEGPIIRHMGRLPMFRHTKGYVRQPVSLARLETAAALRQVLEQIEAMFPSKFPRFIRGLNALKNGLQEQTGQERLHEFVRSLEALVLPAIGSTRSQFAHRCQTFAIANATAKTILEEAYDMRSDAEHLQDWRRALHAYPQDEREDVALHRTRQMERLATFAYSQILQDKTLRAHFEDDISQETFWNLTEGPRKTTWGKHLDLGRVPLVRKYDGFNRAA
jgi:hypothetical protein